MRRERVTVTPDWYEPYNISLAIKAGGLVYVSGQAGFDAHGNTVGDGDFETQARQAFANLETVLAHANSSLADVVKMTILLKDMKKLDKRTDKIVGRGSKASVELSFAGAAD